MTVFLTGATGVLGQPVVRLLRNAGHKVKALCRTPSNREVLETLGAIPIEADLFDAASMARAIDGCEAVFHLATRIPAAADMKKRRIWDTNDRIRRIGMRAITDAAMQTGGVRSVLYPSVSFFYAGDGATWIDAANATTDAARPLLSTLDAEAFVARFAASAPDRRGIVLRFGAFYGPTSGQSEQTLAMARKGFAVPLAPPHAYRSAIWIDDAASAVVRAFEGAPSGVFDVVEDEPATQSEMLAALAEAAGRKTLWALPRWLLKLAVPADLRAVLARSQRVSNARFRDATGWKPAVPNQWEGWSRMARAAGSRHGVPRPAPDTRIPDGAMRC